MYWTQEAKKQKSIPEDNDGLFYMSVEDYLEQMDVTFINYDTSNWHHAYFMMWDDPSENTGTDIHTSFWCVGNCVQHRVIVKSSVK